MTSQEFIKSKRNLRVDQEGTPPLSFLNSGDIDAETTKMEGWIVNFEDETSTAKYSPFDTLIVSNNSSSPLNVYINQNLAWKKRVNGNTILSISDFKGIRNVRVAKVNGAVTISASEVELTVQRKSLSEDELVRRKQSGIFKNLLSRFVGV